MKELVVIACILEPAVNQWGDHFLREVEIFTKKVRAKTYKEAVDMFNFKGNWNVSVQNHNQRHLSGKCFSFRDDSVTPSFTEKI